MVITIILLIIQIERIIPIERKQVSVLISTRVFCCQHENLLRICKKKKKTPNINSLKSSLFFFHYAMVVLSINEIHFFMSCVTNWLVGPMKSHFLFLPNGISSKKKHFSKCLHGDILKTPQQPRCWVKYSSLFFSLLKVLVGEIS